MFFLVRCVFWLWVVFSTIFAQTTADGRAPRHAPAAQPIAVAEPVVHAARSWLSAAAARVANECAAKPAACLAVAAQFSKLAADRAAAPVSPAPAFALRPTLTDVPASNVPLPPRRPSFSFPLRMNSALEKAARREYLMDGARAEADF
jgi:hypothetical protein